ncbi:MAG: hypothetical protein Ct9H300mP20_16110 [Gammaproteobacteria bacterium]|nr:MAG: hypothetical protein Ct9H300mP20_16110 [Gammaproteobacteria bacterium]
MLGLNYSENNAFGTGKRVNIGINDSNWRKSYYFDYGDPYYNIDGVAEGTAFSSMNQITVSTILLPIPQTLMEQEYSLGYL